MICLGVVDFCLKRSDKEKRRGEGERRPKKVRKVGTSHVSHYFTTCTPLSHGLSLFSSNPHGLSLFVGIHTRCAVVYWAASAILAILAVGLIAACDGVTVVLLRLRAPCLCDSLSSVTSTRFGLEVASCGSVTWPQRDRNDRNSFKSSSIVGTSPFPIGKAA